MSGNHDGNGFQMFRTFTTDVRSGRGLDDLVEGLTPEIGEEVCELVARQRREGGVHAVDLTGLGRDGLPPIGPTVHLRQETVVDGGGRRTVLRYRIGGGREVECEDESQLPAEVRAISDMWAALIPGPGVAATPAGPRAVAAGSVSRAEAAAPASALPASGWKLYFTFVAIVAAALVVWAIW